MIKTSRNSHSKRCLMKPQDNSANQQNPNKGTSGYNKQYQAMLDNRSRQLNPLDAKYQGGKKHGK